MSKTASVKLLTLSEALKSDSPNLYVVNQAHKVANGNHGNITMNVHSNSRTVGVSIPHTWIPVDLTTQAPRADILAEPNFRRIVQRGAVVIVETTSAEKFMQDNDPKSYKELQRILNVFSDVESDLQANSNAPQTNELTIQVPGGVSSSNVDPFVEAIVIRAESEPADDLISELTARMQSEGLNSNQIQYIMDNVSSPDIKEWCVSNV